LIEPHTHQNRENQNLRKTNVRGELTDSVRFLLTKTKTLCRRKESTFFCCWKLENKETEIRSEKEEEETTNYCQSLKEHHSRNSARILH
jgi:hypothetical protein